MNILSFKKQSLAIVILVLVFASEKIIKFINLILQKIAIMKKVTLLLLFLAFIATNTINAQSKKELKEQKRIEEFKKLKTLIDSGNYAFTANAAFTQKGRRIDLTLNGGILIVRGELAEGDLPYFGVVQVGGYNQDNGINFNNKNTKYDIKYNEKKRRVIIKFDTKNKTEQFSLILTSGGSGTATLSINSNHRNMISYNGQIHPIKIKKKEE